MPDLWSVLDYPARSNVIINVLIRERGRKREGSEKDEATEARSEECCVAGYEGGGKRRKEAVRQGMWATPRRWKKKQILLQSLQKECSPSNTLILA